MKFIDSTEIIIRSGSGGNGMVSFKTASNKPKLGPDGGDGGNGGHVIAIGHSPLNTLSHLRYRRRFEAQDGKRGGTNGCTGANGENLLLQVPLGTEFYDPETNKKICEILYPGQQVILAEGGRRGLGNMRFLKSTHQAPFKATDGVSGQTKTLRCELKLLADVGLAGLPNAGKSTLLSALSSARPKVADYPFTTLTPSLGVVELSERGEFNIDSFVLADVPGLIEGASTGKGLGHDFLRHLERTKVIAFVVDGSTADSESVRSTLAILENELKSFDEGLAQKKKIVVINKIDALDTQEQIDALNSELAFLKTDGYEVFSVSAFFSEGLVALKGKLFDIVQEENAEIAKLNVQSASTMLIGENDLKPADWVLTEHERTHLRPLVSFREAMAEGRFLNVN